MRSFINTLCCNTRWINISSELQFIPLVPAWCSREGLFTFLVSLGWAPSWRCSLFERNTGISTDTCRTALRNDGNLFYGAFGGQGTAMEAKCWCAQKPFAENPFQPLPGQSLLGESNYSNHLPTHMRKIHRSDKFPTWEVECDKKKGRVEHSSTTVVLFLSLHVPLSHFGTIVRDNHGLTKQLVLRWEVISQEWWA